jgi:small subunit ribosomal protein S6
MFIVNPELKEEALEALIQRIQGYLAEADSQVFSFKSWGLRRLAYPIKRYKEGRYYLVHFAMETRKVTTFEHNLLLAEGVLRELITYLDKEPIEEKAASAPEAKARSLPEPSAFEDADQGFEDVLEAEEE